MEHQPTANWSLKSVIEHLEANQRFELSSPLDIIEKSIPLQLEYLSFNDLKITINNTEYKFGVYKKYDQKSETPRFVQFENSRGGSEYNIDEYGFNDYSQDFSVEKGDVMLASEQWWREAWDEQFEHNQMERSEQRRTWLERKVESRVSA